MTERGGERCDGVDAADPRFADALTGLRNGDFSRLAPLFGAASDTEAEARRSCLLAWVDAGRFDGHAGELAEALSAACFLGRVAVAETLLRRGVDPTAGRRTGLDALHWAVNRGELAAVRLLLRWGAPLETRNRFGGTVLGLALRSAVNEPRADHRSIITMLLAAGADRTGLEAELERLGIDEGG